jgi:phage regulator Rha-like protein
VKIDFKEDEFVNERNRTYPFFWITKNGYMTLVMNMSAKGNSLKLLFEKKQLFIHAFTKMEEIIAKHRTNKANEEWIASRNQGLIARKDCTDTIKDFVEYATNQGSSNAKHYYSNITKMSYKALDIMQQKNPSLRDTLSVMETHQLILAEDLVRRKLLEYMEQGLHYKEIYLLIKLDVEALGKALCISNSRILK